MSEAPSELKYSKSHEWVRVNEDGTVTVGITDHAQELLGDLVYVEVPEQGIDLEAEQACAVVESVKAASDVYAPLAGTVVEVNEDLADSPEIVNRDAYGDGWIMRLEPADSEAVHDLMDASEYQDFIESE
ncbi:MAG: glycine cleavage system protein GcvH [Gammaproteobacteria bacterium]|jgi:glycine cleavage system H protein